MLRNTLIIAVAAISVLWLSGCRKRPSEPESGEVEIKTEAEYEAEAKKKINKKNLTKELEKLEKEIEEDIQK
jgi:hypothetical protein